MVKKYSNIFQAPRILVQMMIMALVTATVTYFYTNSLRMAALYCFACLILLQCGYFGGVLFMVWREKARRQK